MGSDTTVEFSREPSGDEEWIRCGLALYRRRGTVPAIEDGGGRQSEDLLPDGLQQGTQIAPREVRATYRPGEYAVADECHARSHEHHASGRMPGGEADRQLYALKIQGLPVCKFHIRRRRLLDRDSEHPSLVGRRIVQKSVCWMEVNRGPGGAGQFRHGANVVQMCMREKDRRNVAFPILQASQNVLRIGSGIDQDASRTITCAHQVTVRLERAQHERFDPERGRAAIRIGRHGFGQTEKEVPQPQEPVAFGFSNVNPDPLKLLW